ncbi:porin [Aestuariivita boseongensis]|uniref:porin n=1 Tax=Aestuariivita boseongensis TaxID=1470562 RepID=UPI0012FC05FC|nr:porin [Aestuariivita boseongensis]
MRKYLFSTVAVLLVPAAAMAQDAGLGFNGTVTLSYSMNNNDLADYDSINLGLSSDVVFSPNFHVGFDLDAAMLSLDTAALVGSDVDLDWSRFALEPTYNFGNGFSASVYYQSFEVDLSAALIPAINIGTDIESVGIAGQYAQDNWYVGAYFGQSDTDPGLGVLGIDIDDFGLNAGIEMANGLDIYGQFARTSVSITGAPGDVDADLLAVGANYTYANGLMIYGSIARLGIDIPIPGADFDPTQVSLGVAYDLANLGSGIPAVAHLEVAHTSLDLPLALPPGIDDDVTKVSFGINFALGGGAVDVPLDSGARIAKGDIRSALISSLTGLF